MKCELCKKADTEVAIHRMIDGVDRELYVCKKCAEQSDPEEKSAESDGAGDLPPELKSLGGAAIPVPPELITDLLKKMIDSGIETAEILENPTRSKHIAPCPVCGFSPLDFTRLSRLGCPSCYDHFAKQLAPLIHDMHRGGGCHRGKRPEKKDADQ